jgi:hypothetical protein
VPTGGPPASKTVCTSSYPPHSFTNGRPPGALTKLLLIVFAILRAACPLPTRSQAHFCNASQAHHRLARPDRGSHWTSTLVACPGSQRPMRVRSQKNAGPLKYDRLDRAAHRPHLMRLPRFRTFHYIVLLTPLPLHPSGPIASSVALTARQRRRAEGANNLAGDFTICTREL